MTNAMASNPRFFFVAILGMLLWRRVLVSFPTTVAAKAKQPNGWFQRSRHGYPSSLSPAAATLAFVEGDFAAARRKSPDTEASKTILLCSSSSSSTSNDDDTSSAEASGPTTVGTKEQRGPVLKPSTGTSNFDAACVAHPVVLPPKTTNEKWQMYYYGNPGTWANETRGFLPTGYVGLAESDDGICWDKIPGNDLYGSVLAPTGLEDDFDGLHLGVGDVIRSGNGDNELHMYYFGGSFEEVAFGPNMPPSRGLKMRIGKARSIDGGRSWERLGMVLDLDPEEGFFASWPRIIVPDQNENENKSNPKEPLRMLYHAFNGTQWAVFGATSHDGGETWKRDNNKMVIGPGESDGWDGSGVGTRAVARTRDGELVMVYEAVGGQGGPFAGKHRLGLALWDKAGGVWVKDASITGIPGGPILDPGVEPLEPWTSQVIGTPYLVTDDGNGSLRLYYCAKKDSDASMSIGLVESERGSFDPSSWKSVSAE